MAKCIVNALGVAIGETKDGAPIHAWAGEVIDVDTSEEPWKRLIKQGSLAKYDGEQKAIRRTKPDDDTEDYVAPRSYDLFSPALPEGGAATTPVLPEHPSDATLNPNDVVVGPAVVPPNSTPEGVVGGPRG